MQRASSPTLKHNAIPEWRSYIPPRITETPFVSGSTQSMILNHSEMLPFWHAKARSAIYSIYYLSKSRMPKLLVWIKIVVEMRLKVEMRWQNEWKKLLKVKPLLKWRATWECELDSPYDTHNYERSFEVRSGTHSQFERLQHSLIP